VIHGLIATRVIGPVYKGDWASNLRFWKGSEAKLPSELYLAGAVGGVVDHAEIGIVDRGVRRAEDRVIERILRFEADFEGHALAEFR